VTHKKGFAHLVAIILIILSILAVVAILYSQTAKKSPSQTNSNLTSEATVQLKKNYANPFDQKNQYVNPFDQNKNPFDNLK
jgi:cbb3-type cytochrome oxidase subunit 3